MSKLKPNSDTGNTKITQVLFASKKYLILNDVSVFFQKFLSNSTTYGLCIVLVFTLSSCGYHLRASNKIATSYPHVILEMNSQSLLKHPLANALISSDVKLVDEDGMSLTIIKDRLKKVVQSIGANNQVQEYRLEYDLTYSIDDIKNKSIHLEKDYSFDIQQIGGGQQEELTLRKQMAQDMAWAIIRQINASIKD